MLRFTLSMIAGMVTIASPSGLRSVAAQVTYAGALTAGRAFMLDLDDPDPSGSYSAGVTLERRHSGTAFSLGVEAGFHRYLILHQDLPPDVTGWASRLEDIRESWRVTPFMRWGTRGSAVRAYGQVGAGLYLRRISYLQQEHERGMLVLDTRYRSTGAEPGINLGVGLELFPGRGRLGLGVGFRTHSMVGGGDGFNTGEIGVVYRWGNGSRR